MDDNLWTINPEYANIQAYVPDRADIGTNVVEIPGPTETWMDWVADADGLTNAANDLNRVVGAVGDAADRATNTFTGLRDVLDAGTVRGNRARQLWEPELPFYEPPRRDIMHLEEGVEVYIDGISDREAIRRKFAGYFTEDCMEDICSRHLADDEAMISYETGTIIFRYRDAVVAIRRDDYQYDIFQEFSIVDISDRIVLKIKANVQGINIIWHSEDETVATKEPLVVMDQAFEEVFQI